VQVLSGMGGVGKTSLARAYAQRHLDDYGIVWWVRAEDPAVVDAEYRALLEILLPPGEATKVVDVRTVTFGLLAEQDRPWLLVLDNVPDTAVVLPPTGNGHVLITSRATRWPELRTVMPLADDAAVELLTSRSDDTDRAAAKVLATELGGLPLALTQAAGFVRASALTLAKYLQLYRDRHAELLAEGRPTDYPHTVATTWQLAMDRLTEPARDMLNVLTFYAPDAIPVHLIFADLDELERHRAIGDLCAYGLVTPAGSDTISVHRLVQAVTRDLAWADKALELIAAAMPEIPLTATGLAIWNALHTHVLALLDHLPADHPNTLALRRAMADRIGESGDMAGACDVLAHALSIEQRVLGTEHPFTLSTWHVLAIWTLRAGDLARARDLLTELASIRERILGVGHPDTLATWEGLASCAGRSGHPEHARDMFAAVLVMQEQVLGADHPDTLITLGNFAEWTGNAGDPARARDLLVELLPIQQRVSSEEDPISLSVQDGLALWTGLAGDPATALDLFAELLPIRERVLGADHAHTLSTRYNIAHWTGKTGHAVRAHEQFTELLEIVERVWGAAHPYCQPVRDSVEHWAKLAREAEESEPEGNGES
jgi:hypothetical protein